MKKFHVMLMFLVMLVLLTGCGKTEIDLNDYTTVEFGGYEGMGTAYAQISWGKLEDALLESILGENYSEAQELRALGTLLALESDLEAKLSRNSELSNGDKITLSFTFDDDLWKDAGFKLVAVEQNITVAGLPEVELLDPFENLELQYNGIAPLAYVTCNNTRANAAGSYIYFSAEPSSNLSNGDTITITVQGNIPTNQGIALAETEREFTVEGLPYYYQEYAQLSEEDLQALKDYTVDYLDSRYAAIYDQVSHTDFVFEGAYLMVAKEANSWSTYNKLYLVYSTVATSLEGKFDDATVYLPVGFTQLKNTDGVLDYYFGNKIEGTTDLSVGWFSQLAGYTDGVKMYNALAVTQKADYTIEVTGTLEVFGQ